MKKLLFVDGRFDQPRAMLRLAQCTFLKHFVYITCLLSLVFHPLSASAQIPTYVPTSGLVGWWPFNGNANDESGNGNNGTVNGATLTTDRFGVANKAYSFNGSNNYIRINSAPNLNVSSFTISGWFNASALPTDDFLGAKGIFGKWWQAPSVCNGNYNAYLVCLTKPAMPNTSVIGGATSFYEGNLFYANTAISSNTWYHFVFIHDATSGGKMYINGVLYSTNTSIGALCNSTNAINIGADINNGSLYRFFGGKLDDFGLWNRSLSAQEISNLYTSIAPPSIATAASPSLINCGESSTLTANSTSVAQPCIKAELPATLQTGLVGYWPFCGNANDASGNNNNGTVNGATLITDRFGNASSAYSFDGVNDYIDIPFNTSLHGPTGTVNAWINYNDLFSEQKNIFSQPVGRPQLLVFENKGRISWRASDDSFPSAYSNSVLPLGQWVMLTGVYTGTSLSIYINGVFQSSYNTNLLQSQCSSYSFQIGGFYQTNNACSNYIGYSQMFFGKIDDIAIYNRVISTTEIQQLYNLGNVSYSWSTGATTPSITVTPTQTSTYTCTATNAAGSTTSSVSVTVADTLTWTGLYDTDWHKPCNWSPQFVPKCCNNVAVPLTTNQPIVSGIAAAEDLTIYSTNGAQLTVNNGANLQIADCPTTITTTMCPSLAVITTSAVTSVTQITAVSGGTISYQGASAISVRGICWGTSPNPTIANSTTSNGTGIGTFTSNLTGLVAGTTYYVRAYATNGSGTSYGNQVSLVAVNPQPAYASGSVFCTGNPTLVVDVTNPTTGKTWMDRNLGATQVATSSTDAAAYGDLYQWGRGSDGHQCRTSATTTTLSATDQPGNSLFIISPLVPNDWRVTQNNTLWLGVNGINNPCPAGYRLPTDVEMENERLTWSANTSVGAFNSPLKITMTGYRQESIVFNAGIVGNYWTLGINGTSIRNLNFSPSGAGLSLAFRSYGMTVRCIKQ
jgi:hypothetical protein